MKNKTAWYDTTKLPQSMVDGALGNNGWPKLEYSNHYPVLKKLVDLTKDVKTVADLGCGAGEVGRVFNQYNYTGYDLEHIIDNVAKIVNPNLNYQSFDAYEFDYTKLNKYDLIICNGFISELIEPLDILGKIINNTSKYLIIHRQEFAPETELKDYTTYANLTTTRSFISWASFKSLLINHKIIQEMDSHGKSLLIWKV